MEKRSRLPRRSFLKICAAAAATAARSNALASAMQSATRLSDSSSKDLPTPFVTSSL